MWFMKARRVSPCFECGTATTLVEKSTCSQRRLNSLRAAEARVQCDRYGRPMLRRQRGAQPGLFLVRQEPHALVVLLRALYRRHEMIRLIALEGLDLGHGLRAALARRFGVSRSTASRDLKAAFAAAAPCRFCGALLPRRR